MDKKWWTLVAVCLGTFMLLLDITIVNVALPDIQRSLHASFSDLQWVVDAYALTLAALLLTAGSLSDLFGRRIVFVVGLVVFTLGSLLCGLAQSSIMLILSRAGQGVGGAIMFATSLALLAEAFQGKERGTAFGIWGSITGVAVAIGPVLGGVLTSGLSWRWIFFVNIPIGALAVVITLSRVDESRSRSVRRPDWVGFVTFTAALASLVYGLIRSNEHGWSETGVVLCFCAAFTLMVLFLLLELQSSEPMFDLSLFRKPTFAGGSIAAFGLSASLFALLLYIVLYLQNVRGYSALGTGVRLLILSGGIMVAATLSGKATTRIPIRLLIGPGLLLVAVGLYLMGQLTATSSWTKLIPGLIVAGIGAGLINPPLASTAVGVVEPAQSGMASGINSTFRQVGIATGVAALGSIFGSDLASRLGVDLAHSPSPLPLQPGILAKAISGGDVSGVLRAAPPGSRRQLEAIISDAFVHGLDRILIIGAAISLVAGLLSLLLIRAKDFAVGSQAHRPTNVAATHQPDAAGPAPEPPVADEVAQHQLVSVGPPDGSAAGGGAGDGSSGSGTVSTNGRRNGATPGPVHAPTDRTREDSTPPGPAPAGREPASVGRSVVPMASPAAEGHDRDDAGSDGSTTHELSVSLTFRFRGRGSRRDRP
ncbi:MAG: DHA2 family efflux MFS transporter permease subunit [Actinomycetota bacterium]|nr:DHA2 family efflux MFS transporter permease subunit [Actinomycetota bacterium]